MLTSLNNFLFMVHWLFIFIVESALWLVILIVLAMATNRHTITASSASHSHFTTTSSHTHMTFSYSNLISTTIRLLMEFMSFFSILSPFLNYCFMTLIIMHLTHSTTSGFSSGGLIKLLLVTRIALLIFIVSLLSWMLLVIHVLMWRLLRIRIRKYTSSSYGSS
jgi:hypothetical protein